VVNFINPLVCNNSQILTKSKLTTPSCSATVLCMTADAFDSSPESVRALWRESKKLRRQQKRKEWYEHNRDHRDNGSKPPASGSRKGGRD